MLMQAERDSQELFSPRQLCQCPGHRPCPVCQPSSWDWTNLINGRQISPALYKGHNTASLFGITDKPFSVSRHPGCKEHKQQQLPRDAGERAGQQHTIILLALTAGMSPCVSSQRQ